MNPEFCTPFEQFMEILMYKTWMEGTYDKQQNPYFFVTTEPNRMGFLC